MTLAKAYDDPPVERIEAHIIDQMRLSMVARLTLRR